MPRSRVRALRHRLSLRQLIGYGANHPCTSGVDLRTGTTRRIYSRRLVLIGNAMKTKQTVMA